MPGARSLWIVTMKLSPVRIEEKPLMNTASRRGNDIAVRDTCVRERRVEGPAGIDAAR